MALCARRTFITNALADLNKTERAEHRVEWAVAKLRRGERDLVNACLPEVLEAAQKRLAIRYLTEESLRFDETLPER